MLLEWLIMEAIHHRVAKVHLELNHVLYNEPARTLKIFLTSNKRLICISVIYN